MWYESFVYSSIEIGELSPFPASSEALRRIRKVGDGTGRAGDANRLPSSKGDRFASVQRPATHGTLTRPTTTFAPHRQPVSSLAPRSLIFIISISRWPGDLCATLVWEQTMIGLPDGSMSRPTRQWRMASTASSRTLFRLGATQTTFEGPSSVALLALAVFLLCLAAAPTPTTLAQLANNKGRTLTPNIINGTVANPRRFPFVASIQYYIPQISQRIHFCGGTMIAPNLMLTAAHCSDPQFLFQTYDQMIVSSRRYDLRLASDDPKEIAMTGGGIDYKVQAVHIHPGYDPNSTAVSKLERFTYDLAIWVLKPQLPLSYNANFTALQIPIVALPIKKNQNPPEGTLVKAVGWGTTDPTPGSATGSPILMKTTLNTTSLQFCANRLHAVLNYTVICAMGVQTDTCRGDSGGPILVPRQKAQKRWFNTNPLWTQVGITSWGANFCASPGIPGVYTSVAWYIDWIISIRRRYPYPETTTTTTKTKTSTRAVLKNKKTTSKKVKVATVKPRAN